MNTTVAPPVPTRFPAESLAVTTKVAAVTPSARILLAGEGDTVNVDVPALAVPIILKVWAPEGLVAPGVLTTTETEELAVVSKLVGIVAIN